MIIKRAAVLLGALAIGGGTALTFGTPPVSAGVPDGITVYDAGPITEGDPPDTTPLQFEIGRTGPTPECRFAVSTQDGTADGADYAGFANTWMIFPEGFTSVYVTVQVTGDLVFEDYETLHLVASLVPVSAGEVAPCASIVHDTGIGTIQDDDEPGPLTVSLNDDKVICETGDHYGKVRVYVDLSRHLAGDDPDTPENDPELLTFDLLIQNGDANTPTDFDINGVTSNYGVRDGVNPFLWHFTLPGYGSYSPYLKFPIVDDWTTELVESFEILLQNVNLTGTNGLILGDERTNVIINDNDVPGQEIYVNDPSVVEGDPWLNPDMPFVVSLKYPAICEGLKFYYETADGTAKDYGSNDPDYGDRDYYDDSGWKLIPAGASSTNIPIEVKSDDNIEDDETFHLDIIKPTGIPNPPSDFRGTGTILNDDFPDVDINDVQVVEGTGGTTNLVFTATLVAPGWPPPCIHSLASATFTPTNGPAFNATGGTFPTVAGDTTTDYSSAVGTVTFAPTECSKTITIPVVTDSRPENNENLTVTLSNFQDLVPGDEDGQGTIWNDDNWVVTGTDIAVLEGTPPGDANHVELVTLTLNAPAPTIPTPPGPPAALSLNWSLEDLPGGASAAQPDYIDANGTVTWTAGTTQVTVPATIVVDEVIELDEALLVAVSNPTSLGAADCWGGCFRLVIDGKDPVTITIINDDFELPETGASMVPQLTVLGFGLAAAGLVLVLGTRRRRPSIS